jgi:hypothetical protein
VSAVVVLADGATVLANKQEHADLFWALKGGGGNFGIVVTFEFALHPIGPLVAFSGPVFPIEAGAGPIRFWRDFLADKGDRVGSIVEFSTIPIEPGYPEPAWGKRVYTIASLFAGDAAEVDRAENYFHAWATWALTSITQDALGRSVRLESNVSCRAIAICPVGLK